MPSTQREVSKLQRSPCSTLEEISGKPKDVPVTESIKRRLRGTSSEASGKKFRSSKPDTQPEMIIADTSFDDNSLQKKTRLGRNFPLTLDKNKDISEVKFAVLNQDLSRNKKNQTSVLLLENKKQNTLLKKTETVKCLENVLGQDDISFDVSLDAGTKAESQIITPPRYQSCSEIDTEWRQDAKAWRMCIAKNDKNEALRLICERILPDHEMLNKASTSFGSELQVLNTICSEISSFIKAQSKTIINVYAGYEHKDDKVVEENELVFAVITTSTIPVENKFGYKIEQICIHEVNSSLENKDIKLKEREYQMNEEEIIKAENTMTSHSQALMKMHKNITRISVSWVKSTKFGTADAAMRKEVCVTVYVPKKGLIPIDEKPFPQELDGFPVDIREGVCVPYLGPQDVHQNIKMGCTISAQRMSGQSCTGTLGGFFERKNIVYGLTCAHVFFRNPNLTGLESNGSWETEDINDELNFVYQPSLITGPFGSLTKAVLTSGDDKTSGVDAAIFKVQNRHPISGIFPDAENDHKAGFDKEHPMKFNSGKLSEKVEKKAFVVKHGSSTGITKGRFRLHRCSVRLNIHGLIFEFYKQYEIESIDDTEFANKGDSGAMVFTVEDKELIGIGIVEGGSSDVCFVTPIYGVLRALGVNTPYKMKTFVLDTGLNKKDTKCSEHAIFNKRDNSDQGWSQDLSKQMNETSIKNDQ